MKIAIGSDHGGFELKAVIVKHLKDKNVGVIDLGPSVKESVHYPVYGIRVAEAVQGKQADLGIVVCSTGEGICIAANKVKGIRCGLIYDDNSAHLTKEHNNCNVIAFGQKTMTEKDVLKRLDIFLDARFEGGRHQDRLDIISNYEK